jgi:hypothetical protein
MTYSGLRFRPKVLSTLHGHIWMVFDAAPQFIFHYLEPLGIVGIYAAPTRKFDFRRVLGNKHFRISDFESSEYRIAEHDSLASCKE